MKERLKAIWATLSLPVALIVNVAVIVVIVRFMVQMIEDPGGLIGILIAAFAFLLVVPWTALKVFGFVYVLVKGYPEDAEP